MCLACRVAPFQLDPGSSWLPRNETGNFTFLAATIPLCPRMRLKACLLGLSKLKKKMLMRVYAGVCSFILTRLVNSKGPEVVLSLLAMSPECLSGPLLIFIVPLFLFFSFRIFLFSSIVVHAHTQIHRRTSTITASSSLWRFPKFFVVAGKRQIKFRCLWNSSFQRVAGILPVYDALTVQETISWRCKREDSQTLSQQTLPSRNSIVTSPLAPPR